MGRFPFCRFARVGRTRSPSRLHQAKHPGPRCHKSPRRQQRGTGRAARDGFETRNAHYPLHLVLSQLKSEQERGDTPSPNTANRLVLRDAPIFRRGTLVELEILGLPVVGQVGFGGVHELSLGPTRRGSRYPEMGAPSGVSAAAVARLPWLWSMLGSLGCAHPLRGVALFRGGMPEDTRRGYHHKGSSIFRRLGLPESGDVRGNWGGRLTSPSAAAGRLPRRTGRVRPATSSPRRACSCRCTAR